MKFPDFEIYMEKLSRLEQDLTELGYQVELYARASQPPYLQVEVDHGLHGYVQYIPLEKVAETGRFILRIETILECESLSPVARQNLCGMWNETSLCGWVVADEAGVTYCATYPERGESVHLFMTLYTGYLRQLVALMKRM